MKFAIITHVFHKEKNESYYAYEPYVREMNLWGKHVEQFLILAHKKKGEPTPVETAYQKSNINFTEIPSFDITSVKNILTSLFVIPVILMRIYKVMNMADHIHLRCPGNIGLLGCFVQILFPNKPKIVKYAGNWDSNSKQPWSYRLQKWIVSNTFLTKNCKVLVYGEWENQTKNILPFFTATYDENEIEEIAPKSLNDAIIRLIFVGAFSVGKQPLTSIQVVEKLHKSGKRVQLHMYGNGVLFEKCNQYIIDNNLQEVVVLHGNQSKDVVKKAFQQAHFLIFISKSEGWPKVVAEAMFWSCLPISTAVSCVSAMLGNGTRGSIVSNNIDTIVDTMNMYFKTPTLYDTKVVEAKKWSQEYTLNRFEAEIKKLLTA